jgi:hypothetical protein
MTSSRSYSHRNDDLEVRVSQSNGLDDGDDNLNRAVLAQEGASGNGSSHRGSHSYGRGDNDADVDQDIDSGDNSQNNDLDIRNPRADGDLFVDVGQENGMVDDDVNTNYANIGQVLGGSGGGNSHRGGHSYGRGGDNDADVDQDIDSGGNSQHNDLDLNNVRSGDDVTVNAGQSNEMDDGDRNTNFAEITQELSGSGGGYNRGHGGGSGDNDADVDQDIDSGDNRQKNFADLDDIRSGEDLDLTTSQSNYMRDDDINTNGAAIDQSGGRNDADVEQDIDSGGNHQGNVLDFDPDGGGGPVLARGYGGHDSHGGRGGDVAIDAGQANEMDDGDDNLNDTEISQSSSHGRNNDADVDQDIDSGGNHQGNFATLDDIRVRGDLDVTTDQFNGMDDGDINTNAASIDQSRGDNDADVDQNIDSGGNSQKNYLDLDVDSGHSSYGRGHGGYGGHGGDDTAVNVAQGNEMDDGDDNMNDAAITQEGGRGSDNDADVWQDIDSGGNSQRNVANLDVGGRGNGGEYDVEQVNWMADDDTNTNRATIDQSSADNWADVDQTIDSGGNHQSNSFDLDFG